MPTMKVIYALSVGRLIPLGGKERTPSTCDRVSSSPVKNIGWLIKKDEKYFFHWLNVERPTHPEVLDLLEEEHSSMNVPRTETYHFGAPSGKDDKTQTGAC